MIIPPTKPQAEPRLLLRKILWYKFVQYINQSSRKTLLRTASKAVCITLLTITTFAPSFVLGNLLAALQWNHYRVPTFFLVLALAMNAERLYAYLRRVGTSAKGNSSLYRGVAVCDLVNFLQETKAFKRDESIDRLSLSQGQYAKIGEELEKEGLLIRGADNARVLRPISREHLSKQLLHGFPLKWDADLECWVEKVEPLKIHHPAFTKRKIEGDTVPMRRALFQREAAHSPTLPSLVGAA